MSGSQTYQEMINQPAATDTDLLASWFPILTPGLNGAKPRTKLATADQVTAMVITGKAVGSQVTQNTTPTPFVGMPVVPESGGYSLVWGTVTVHDQITRDTMTWNIMIIARRVAGNLMCDAQGDLAPAPFNPGQGSVATCTLALSVNSGGPAVVGAGNANPCLWRWNLNADIGA